MYSYNYGTQNLILGHLTCDQSKLMNGTMPKTAASMKQVSMWWYIEQLGMAKMANKNPLFVMFVGHALQVKHTEAS